ncbi:hypothetical protein GCM10022409_29530 [Hymenobacter glaciei]|uniref:Nuclear transport factor 2 family protein n=1 Tax=Hymenobacter glaciei TaxID=877209 RepID=A0ABP7UED7_9BACT
MPAPLAKTNVEKIIAVITNFVRGGDHRDTGLLDQVFHPDFQVASHGFLGTAGVTLLSRHQYLANVEAGIFGGVPRLMTIEHVDVSGGLAMVKLRLESAENHFLSYNSLVADAEGNWQLLYNVAVVVPRNDPPAPGRP